MISVKQLAEEFEEGLNNVLNNPEIQFKIWANVGKYQPPLRDGNTVNYEIVGNLRTSTSANDANNLLVMGINGVAIEFMVPAYPLRTNSKQTEAELAKIKDGQYPFIEYICNAINSYFQTSQSLSLTDEEGTIYSVAFLAGTVIPGTVDIQPGIGNALPVTVYAEVYFGEGVINSKGTKIYVDGELMPFQSFRLGRAPVTENDVYAGDTVSKMINSSTAFTIDADFPASENSSSNGALDYVINGEPNTAHFVNVDWGNGVQKLFFMTYNTVQAAARGISIVGISASFMELVGNQSAYSVPQGYQITRFKLDNSITESGQPVTLSFTLSQEVNCYISGVGAAKRGGAQYIQLTSQSYSYDEGAGVYYVDLITETTVTITNASAEFTVL